MSTAETVPPPPAEVLILCTDLIFSTKITGTAKALGRAYVVVRTVEKLTGALSAAVPGPLLIVDLNATGVDPVAAIVAAKGHGNVPRVVAFLSHVQAELAAAARGAGADVVMARSGFVNALPELVGGRA